jgi:ubiquinone/menaquinone biosynthesis C-methylase UbiE
MARLSSDNGIMLPVTSTTMSTDHYLLGHSTEEEGRLRRQVREFEAEARWLLDQLELKPGARAIDLGCGLEGILGLLAERVGPTGRVVGIEKDSHFAELARRFAADQGKGNIEVLQGDAKATGLPREDFDLVHARLILVNIPEPERVVEEMVALARPGGMVASHEADYIAHVCDPPSHAWNRLFDAFEAYSRSNGIDLFVGRKTHRMFRSAGVTDVRVNPVVHVYPHGHGRRTIFWDFARNLRDRLLASGLISESEMDGLLNDLQHDLADPGRLVISHLFFQIWGRKA